MAILRIMFMGTASFAVPSLAILAENGYAIPAVVTGPERPRGRGRKMSPTPVKELAVARGLHVLQPEKLKDQAFAGEVRSLDPDLIVVVAYRILPPEVFSIPRLGSINLHASLLPRYRGVAVPDAATSRPLAVPDPAAADGTTEVTLVEFEDRGYRVRLIDHPPAFDREGYYGDSGGDYPDNGWRFGLLCRAAIEALLADERPVDVLHLHDWQAMPAVVLRDCAYQAYPLISRSAVMVTIHNLAYQGWLSREGAAGMLFPEELTRVLSARSDGILLLREGILRAELVNTVSPGYAQEIVDSDRHEDPLLPKPFSPEAACLVCRH